MWRPPGFVRDDEDQQLEDTGRTPVISSNQRNCRELNNTSAQRWERAGTEKNPWMVPLIACHGPLMGPSKQVDQAAPIRPDRSSPSNRTESELFSKDWEETSQPKTKSGRFAFMKKGKPVYHFLSTLQWGSHLLWPITSNHHKTPESVWKNGLKKNPC